MTLQTRSSDILPFVLKLKGTFSYESGAVYEGEWRKDVRSRHGTFSWWKDSSIRYEGEWKKDIFHGSGKMSWPDGSIYDGSWIEGKREGVGKMTWPDGAEYDGQWHLDLMHGR